MILTMDLEGNRTEIEFTWESLRAREQPCWLWTLERAQKSANDRPVVYRHVVEVPSLGVVTIYVGEGDSLNGPKKFCLVYQYSHGGHGLSRVKVRNYLNGRNEDGWTEVLKISKPMVDLSDTRQRKFLQTTLISFYYWQHRNLMERGFAVPDFLNDPR